MLLSRGKLPVKHFPGESDLWGFQTHCGQGTCCYSFSKHVYEAKLLMKHCHRLENHFPPKEE